MHKTFRDRPGPQDQMTIISQLVQKNMQLTEALPKLAKRSIGSPKLALATTLIFAKRPGAKKHAKTNSELRSPVADPRRQW